MIPINSKALQNSFKLNISTQNKFKPTQKYNTSAKVKKMTDLMK